jgi:translocation and assembly module TamB
VPGRRLALDHGTPTHAGDLIPFVDLTATTTTTDATVSLNVVGRADDPDITFTSTSGLPEEEVLSRLLFNRSVSGLSPLQAAQLVDAAAQLTGIAGGGGFFSRVRQATGLDDLDIRQNASGGAAVGIAKQVSDNLRLGVEAGSGAGRVTIDLDITENLKARGEAGEDGGSLGLTYEREY